MTLSSSPENVLIVEDDHPTRRALAKLLEVAGFRVTTAGSLAEARNNLANQCMVLLDLGLPDGNGEQLLGQLRSMQHPATVAVISAQLDPRTDSRFRWSHPPDASFAKPLDIERFLAWLAGR